MNNDGFGRMKDLGEIKELFLSSLFSTLISFLILIISVTAVAGILMLTDDPGKYSFAASLVIMISVSAVSGVIGEKRSESVWGGALSGALLVLLLLVISLFFPSGIPGGSGEYSKMPFPLMIHLSEVAVAAVFAFLSSYLKRKNRRTKTGVKLPKIKKYR